MNANPIDSVYLQTKIEPLLQFLLTEIILEQPLNPGIFVIDKLLAVQFREAEQSALGKLVECVRGHLLLLEGRLQQCSSRREDHNQNQSPPADVKNIDSRGMCNTLHSLASGTCQEYNLDGSNTSGFGATVTTHSDASGNQFPRGFSSRHRRGVAAATFRPGSFEYVNIQELDQRTAAPWILNELRSSPLLAKYPSKTLNRLAKACEPKSYSSGTILWAPGFSDSLESTLIIETGEVEVLSSPRRPNDSDWRTTATGSRPSRCRSPEGPHVEHTQGNNESQSRAISRLVSSKVYSKGVILEEVALYNTLILDEAYRAKSNLMAWGIHRDVFQCIVQATAMERRDVYRKIIDEYLHILGGPQQPSPRPGFLDDLASTIQETEFQDGEVILKEGDVIKSVFYIETGIVRRSTSSLFSVQPNSEPIHYKAGQFFGALDSASTGDNIGCETHTAIATVSLDAISKYSFTVSTASLPANVIQIPLLIIRALKHGDLRAKRSTTTG